MGSSKVVIAGAGSGKTTFVVEDAVRHNDKTILITTFTQANEQEIRKKIIEYVGCIPAHITVQTWFSFLLQHGVRPYQGCKYTGRITGLFLKSGQSAIGIAETDIERHYLTPDHKIYSDKVAKFAIRCNELTNGAVIARLISIYDYIYIDEVQDLAGYDLELLKLLIDAETTLTMVGDPRQSTYSTNDGTKNKKFKKAGIINFFYDEAINIERDDITLNTNYRCHPNICSLSNKLYPELKEVKSGFKDGGEAHQGIFLVNPSDIGEYLAQYGAVQLRDSKKAKGVNDNYRVMNFGASKGLTFDRVLIHTTGPIREWLKTQEVEGLALSSKSKLYVAITRARLSVSFVTDDDIGHEVFERWEKPLSRSATSHKE
jgi:superfamily I DNA/RNA helicase